MKFARPAVGVLALTLGLLAEGAGYGWSQPVLWVPDLAVGLVWCVVGLRFWTVLPGVSFLALGVGITWFLASLVPATVFWHRGLLITVLLVLAFAGRRRVFVAAVVFVLLASITPRVWAGEGETIALAGLLLVVTAGLASRSGPTTLARAAQSCLVVTCLALIASALTRLAAPEPGAAALPALLAYEATLVIVGLVVLAAAGVKVPNSVADRVLELSDGPASSLRDALAEVLDDPDLEVGYWRDHARGYTDLEGQQVVPPQPGTGRAGLPIHEGGLPVALVVHDARLQDDPRLAAAVGAGYPARHRQRRPPRTREGAPRGAGGLAGATCACLRRGARTPCLTPSSRTAGATHRSPRRTSRHPGPDAGRGHRGGPCGRDARGPRPMGTRPPSAGPSAGSSSGA